MYLCERSVSSRRSATLSARSLISSKRAILLNSSRAFPRSMAVSALRPATRLRSAANRTTRRSAPRPPFAKAPIPSDPTRLERLRAAAFSDSNVFLCRFGRIRLRAISSSPERWSRKPSWAYSGSRYFSETQRNSPEGGAILYHVCEGLLPAADFLRFEHFDHFALMQAHLHAVADVAEFAPHPGGNVVVGDHGEVAFLDLRKSAGNPGKTAFRPA